MVVSILYWGFGDNYRKECIKELFKEKIIYYSGNEIKSKSKIIKALKMFVRDLKAIKYLKKANIVYIPPMEYTFMKVFLCRLYRKKVLTDVYAPIFDMTVNDEKKYKRHSFIARFYFKRDRYVIKKSSVALFLNIPERDYFLKQYKIKNHKNRVDILPLYIPQKKEAMIKYYKGERKTIQLCWTGTFINLQGVDKIIEAAKVLADRNFSFKLYILGPDKPQKDNWKEQVKNLNLTSYIFFPDVWGSFEKWENFIVENCDISLGIFGESQKAKTVVANKVIDGIAFKTPLITAQSTGIDYYFKNQEIYITKNDPICIADKIIEVSELDYETVRKNIDLAYQIYETTFSKQSFKNGFSEIVNSCLIEKKDVKIK